jgi:hypothetical protein
MIMFTDSDLKQIENKGITIDVVNKQLENFKKGFPYINLHAPATAGNGILTFSEEEAAKRESFYNDNFGDYHVLKFVPASGAASRMFKHLHEFRQKYNGTPEDIAAYEADKSFNSVWNFFTNIKKFAFYQQLKSVMAADGLDIDALISKKDFNPVLDYFLTDKGLGYSLLPKGLLLFHNYDDEPRMALEEHLVEAARYAANADGVATVHFTVSPEHQKKFEEAVNNRKGKYEKRYNVSIEVSYSQQKPSTDTIAVDMNNEPFRNDDGTILFRPGGHGALIENLNDLKGEIVFVKNIDNVVSDRLREPTVLYKKVIGGVLLDLQDRTFAFLEALEEGNLTDDEIEEIKTFANRKLNIFIPDAYHGFDKMEKIDFLFNKLNRPVRVCGMVKNEGEPGGGPFWVKDENDELSLQIVESSQIDFSKPDQKEIVSNATHFNPVDLVCGVRDYKGDLFDLREYVDPKTGFISQKSKDGRDLKAQELPGLWNGAMADWITVFVETPLITFNPVKTINDLLREQHQ